MSGSGADKPAAPAAFRTLRGEGCAEFVEKKSRFVGYAAPVVDEAAALAFIESVRRRHPDSSCVLYGYRCGPGGTIQRFFDAHEPCGGLLILEALKKPELIGAAAVARYWGGVKLGAGPLGRAFGRAAALAVENAGVCMAEPTLTCRLDVQYEHADSVERLLRRSRCRLVSTDYTDGVAFTVDVRHSDHPLLVAQVAELTAGRAACTELSTKYCCWE